MRYQKLLSSICGAAILLAAAPAFAVDIVYVSGKGNNANSCATVAAPCLTLQAAHNKVAAGGEIVVLDSASYGPLSITKSISVVNDGAGVADIRQATAGANAITINAPSGVVHLRGLSLDGAGAGANGVLAASVSSLTMINCAARRFTSGGVYVRPSSGVTNVAIIDSIMSDNARGVNLAPLSTGQIQAIMTNMQATGNSQYGLAAAGQSKATVVGGAFSKNGSSVGGAGVYALTGASIMARDTVASNNNASGFFAFGAGAMIRAAHSVASGNATGFRAASGGAGETYGDNNLRGNTTALTAGVTTVSAQ